MSSPDKSITAYENASRVAAYDGNMELMHPNRQRMVEVILDVLAATGSEPGLVLDLGTGTGFLLQRLFDRFPRARMVAVDGAAPMLDLARERLGQRASRADFRVCDFRDLAPICEAVGPVDAVVSTFALHHLSGVEKTALARTALSSLRPGGWFLSGDLVVSEDAYLEALTQRMRVRGIVARAAGHDPRFADEGLTEAFLRKLEQEDNDQPQPLAADLQGLQRAGFEHVSVFWRETREVVLGGVKPRSVL